MLSVAELAVAASQFLGALIWTVVGYTAWQRRDHPAARPLAKMSVPIVATGLCFGTLVSVTGALQARVLLAIGYAALTLSVIYLLCFALVYTGRETVRSTRWYRGVFGTVVLVAVIRGVGLLVRAEIEFVTQSGITLPVAGGVLASKLLAAVTAYAVLLVSAYRFGAFLFAPENMYRKQTAVLFVASIVSTVASAVFIGGVTPHPGLDLTPVFLTVLAVIYVLTLFRTEFLAVEPVAPDIVLQEMDDPVFVLDEDDVVVSSNPAAEPLLGDESPVGTHIETVLPGLLEASASGDQFRLDETHGQSDGGRTAIYDLNRAPVEDQYGLDRGSVLVLREITVQKQRERTIESLQSVSQEFLVAEDKEAVFETAAETAESVLGYPYSGALAYDEAEECLRPVAFSDTLEAGYERAGVEPVVEPGSNDIWQAFERNEPLLGESPELGIPSDAIPVPIKHTLLVPLGEHGILGISGGPEHEGFSKDDRRFIRVLATTTENALDRVQKESELRESRELLRRRTDQIEFFNGVLRHDLINAMTIVRSTADQLAGTVDGSTADQVQTIQEYSDDIMTLAQKVRSITRTVSDDRDVELEPVNLGAAIDRKARKIEESHDDATVTVDAPLDSLDRVRADDLLPEVIENLLLNAVEHNDTDAPAIEIDVEERDGMVVVRIADNGPGVPDDQKEEIFEERITSDQSGSIGFGLYFVRVMIDRYGGSVRFEDNEPRGAIAVLELPTTASVRDRSTSVA